MSKHVLSALLLFWPSLLCAKRPLTADDYDSWRHIQNQVLSDDGHYLAYGLFPQQGDGEIVVRDLKTGKEVRQPAGELPPPPPPDFSSPQREEPPPLPPGIALRFSADSRFLVFSTFPMRAAIQAAKREKRKPEAMPKGDIVIVELASGAITREARVRDFQLPTRAGDYLAYVQLPEPAGSELKTAAPAPQPRAAIPAGDPKVRKLESGDLVLRNLNTGAERRFSQVSQYLLARDAGTLVYAVSIPAADTNDGVFALDPASDAEPTALLGGEGRYRELTWDEDQTRVAFLSDRDHPRAAIPEWKLYTWDRHTPAATALMSNDTAGVPEDWSISGRANLTVAKGGSRIFLSTAPDVESAPPPPNLPEDERVSVDLWSWKDDYIQPMQKIRARSERHRAYRGVFDLMLKKYVQLADPTMNDLVPSEDGEAAIGNDDRAYRRLEEFDNHYFDTYVVNTSTGERMLAARKHVNRVTWSPTSNFAIYFNGKDWIAIDTKHAREVNLTARLGVPFANEQNDIPNVADSYRLAGWTPNGSYVILYDRYDVWRCAPDGSSALNLTGGIGRKNRLQFRLVRFNTDEPESRWIDLEKPLLLRAENDQTHDTGFYELRPGDGQRPRKLVFEAKNFAPPIKARSASVYLTAASTFSQYPDLLVTDSSFRNFQKVSNAAPQLANLSWGSAELVHYNNLDGVPLQAILYKPENFDPAKKYPLLVYIYERLTQNVNNFIEPRPYNSISPSMYVSNGYLVLEPDIVYRVGYPGQSALNCVLPAIQSVVNQGFVDEKAIGIQGHSWGGYQIAYMITRTSRFRAAAAGAPVADMISAYDGIRWGPGVPRQFQYEKTQSRIGGSVWEYPLRYIENSPVFMADRVTTPLLMIHNDGDDAVPWYQGIEYYLALRRLNKEVYMFDYNGEAHNLRRRADQKDYSLRLQQYFDHFLKGAPEPDWMRKGIPYLEKPGVAATLSADDEP